MDENGTMTSLASSVLSFDIGPGDVLVYTNGSEIFQMRNGEKPDRICSHRMIHQVMAISVAG